MSLNSNLVRVFKLVLWLLFALVVLLLVVLPLLTSLLIKAGQMPLEYINFLKYVEIAQMYLMRLLGVIWLFFLGSCFASFLNVVAWRIPRGRGINGSSQCPSCNNKLRFSDNLPIYGWIRNGGRCRDCQQPISPRYLIVEIILGCVFLLVCSVEILAGGANLPIREIEHLQGFEHLVFAPKWDLIQLSIYHLGLICLVFTFALIRSESLKVPVSIFVTGLLIGAGLPLIWPNMLIVSWQLESPQLLSLERFSPNQLITIAAGLGGGILCGSLVAWSVRQESLRIESQSRVAQSGTIADGIAGLALVGLFLGWQSAISVTILTLVLSLLSGSTRQLGTLRTLNLSTRLLVATVLHLLLWRITTWVYFWPSQSTGIIVMAISIVVMIILAGLVRASGAGIETEIKESPESILDVETEMDPMEPLR